MPTVLIHSPSVLRARYCMLQLKGLKNNLLCEERAASNRPRTSYSFTSNLIHKALKTLGIWVCDLWILYKCPRLRNTTLLALMQINRTGARSEKWNNFKPTSWTASIGVLHFNTSEFGGGVGEGCHQISSLMFTDLLNKQDEPSHFKENISLFGKQWLSYTSRSSLGQSSL